MVMLWVKDEVKGMEKWGFETLVLMLVKSR